MSPQPPELYSSDDDSEFDGFHFSGDYDEVSKQNVFFSTFAEKLIAFIFKNEQQFGDRIKPTKPVPVVNIENETGMQLYRCVFENDYEGFSEIWKTVHHQDIDRPLRTFEWTPLMFACQNRHVEFARRLLTGMHANPNANSNDMTALILACSGPFDMYSTTHDISSKDEENTLKLCEMLIQHGAMVDKANLRRETALMYAAGNGFVSVMKYLLDNGATLEACDRDDCTALFYAIREDRFDAVKVLIEAGALIDAQDRDGRKPKQLAQDSGFDDLLPLFPPDPIYEFVPQQFTSYDTPYDLIPTAFPDKET